MDWLPEILKQLQTSRALVTAAFVVCLFILFGHIISPNLIPQTPDNWKLPVMGGLLFSSTLLVFIIVPFLWQYFYKIIINRTQNIRTSKLSNDEQHCLYNMALMIEGSRVDFVNLSNLNYSNMSISKLELQEIISKLSNKGLVDVNPFDSNLISFTDSGRRKALEIKNNVM